MTVRRVYLESLIPAAMPVVAADRNKKPVAGFGGPATGVHIGCDPVAGGTRAAR
jgi:hypothetical protein